MFTNCGFKVNFKIVFIDCIFKVNFLNHSKGMQFSKPKKTSLIDILKKSLYVYFKKMNYFNIKHRLLNAFIYLGKFFL